MPKPSDPSTFDHHNAPAMQDIHSDFAEWRSKCPVAKSENYGGFYFAMGFDSAKQVLSDFRNFTSSEGVQIPAKPIRQLPVNLDPPLQTKFRKVLNRYFTPESAQAHKERAEALVDSLIDSFIELGSTDAAKTLTRATVHAFMLPFIGIPPEDRPRLTEAIDWMSNHRMEDAEKTKTTNEFIFDYLETLCRKRTEVPTGETDVIQFLIDNKIDGEILSDRDKSQLLIVILFGALDTTHATLNNSLLHLARNPQDKDRLIAQEVSWSNAIEEFVRAASPIFALRRTATKDIELEGQTIPEGSPVLALLGAGNRDPEQFPEPDTCIISRDASSHIGFGAGAHVCLGRYFARLMIETVLTAVLTRLPDFSVAEDFVPTYTAGEGRRIISLPISFTPGPRKQATAQ